MFLFFIQEFFYENKFKTHFPTAPLPVPFSPLSFADMIFEKVMIFEDDEIVQYLIFLGTVSSNKMFYT